MHCSGVLRGERGGVQLLFFVGKTADDLAPQICSTSAPLQTHVIPSFETLFANLTLFIYPECWLLLLYAN